MEWSILTNQILWATIISFLVSQGLKMILQKNFAYKALFAPGGMPSSHTAPAVALCTSIYLTEGGTTAFVIAIVFAVAIIRDSLGVRYAVGENAKEINKLGKRVFRKDYTDLHEVHGHRPIEVFAGALIGLIVSFTLYFLW